MTPQLTARLVDLATAMLYVRYPEALRLPREQVRRAVARQVLIRARRGEPEQ